MSGQGRQRVLRVLPVSGRVSVLLGNVRKFTEGSVGAAGGAPTLRDRRRRRGIGLGHGTGRGSDLVLAAPTDQVLDASEQARSRVAKPAAEVSRYDGQTMTDFSRFFGGGQSSMHLTVRE
jgi:hypothetical protein